VSVQLLDEFGGQIDAGSLEITESPPPAPACTLKIACRPFSTRSASMTGCTFLAEFGEHFLLHLFALRARFLLRKLRLTLHAREIHVPRRQQGRVRDTLLCLDLVRERLDFLLLCASDSKRAFSVSPRQRAWPALPASDSLKTNSRLMNAMRASAGSGAAGFTAAGLAAGGGVGNGGGCFARASVRRR
jgi:hypothetical protein